MGQEIDHVHELSYYDRKRIHNLKYYTWVEQQGKTYEEIQGMALTTGPGSRRWSTRPTS